jgi:hypothetical protein
MRRLTNLIFNLQFQIPSLLQSVLKFSISHFAFLRKNTQSRTPHGVRGPQVKKRCSSLFIFWILFDTGRSPLMGDQPIVKPPCTHDNTLQNKADLLLSGTCDDDDDDDDNRKHEMYREMLASESSSAPCRELGVEGLSWAGSIASSRAN